MNSTPVRIDKATYAKLVAYADEQGVSLIMAARDLLLRGLATPPATSTEEALYARVRFEAREGAREGVEAVFAKMIR